MSVIRYHVPVGVPQSTSPICWLACAVMIMQYKRGSTHLTMAELGIVGDGVDYRISSVASPATYSLDQGAFLRQWGFTLARLQPRPRGCAPSDEAYVQSLLREHGPLILNHYEGSFWYGANRVNLPKGVPKNPPGTPPQGHSVVITGWDSTLRRVYFNNPWGDTDVPTTESSIMNAIRRWETPYRFSLAYLP
ncbi:MAG: papain-like cysteine protease family protein [Candidatus Acidiferrales bacterium]